MVNENCDTLANCKRGTSPPSNHSQRLAGTDVERILAPVNIHQKVRHAVWNTHSLDRPELARLNGIHLHDSFFALTFHQPQGSAFGHLITPDDKDKGDTPFLYASTLSRKPADLFSERLDALDEFRCAQAGGSREPFLN